MKSNPLALVILDGFGHRTESKYNAIAQAKKPMLDYLMAHYPHTLLEASGSAVGLPEGYIGNSEVGHQTMGAGRIIPSPFLMLHKAIADGSFFTNPTITASFASLAQTGKTLHIIGLLSDAGVQCHQEIIYALLEAAAQWHIKKVVIHAILDGRDVAPKSAATYLQALQDYITRYPQSHIGSIIGRYYAMDRDNHWDRTQKAYDNLVTMSTPEFSTWQEALVHYYSKSITDEFIPPTILQANSSIQDNDGIVFTNFRADRARQLAACFIENSLESISDNSMSARRPSRRTFGAPQDDRKDAFTPEFAEGLPSQKARISVGWVISSVRYKQEYNNPVLLETNPIADTLKEILSKEGKSIFSIAETEKYAHISYFFSGGHEDPFSKEKQILIPSLSVKTYEHNPEMSALLITDTVIKSLQSDPSDFYLINYANADMVGHSGNLSATIKAIECLDLQIGQLYEQLVKKMDGTLIITADHGNAELMFDEKAGQSYTAHTTNKVPFICAKNDLYGKKINLSLNGLADIASFVLSQMK